jgi:hypothetical protein
MHHTERKENKRNIPEKAGIHEACFTQEELSISGG